MLRKKEKRIIDPIYLQLIVPQHLIYLINSAIITIEIHVFTIFKRNTNKRPIDTALSAILKDGQSIEE